MSGDPDRILVTADLHFGLYAPGDECTRKMAEFVRDSGADAFIIAGDVGDAESQSFRGCLELFGDFPGEKLVTPGNHDLWTTGPDSYEKYQKSLPALAADCGFHMLDVGPVAVGRIGFLGNIGWYDYSFRSGKLNVEPRQYARKELPGVCLWNDVRFIEWDMTDEQFTEKCVRKLERNYRTLEPRVHTVVAVLHHVPFRELLYGPSSAAYEFCRAFMGSERLGRLLLDCPKVRYVFSGHRHGQDAASVDHLEAFVVGSEYRRKRLLEVHLEEGRVRMHLFEPSGPAESRKLSPPPGQM